MDQKRPRRLLVAPRAAIVRLSHTDRLMAADSGAALGLMTIQKMGRSLVSTVFGGASFYSTVPQPQTYPTVSTELSHASHHSGFCPSQTLQI